MNLLVLKNLLVPTYFLVMLGSSLVYFDMNYYLMNKLPGSRNFMCLEAGNITTGNVIFVVTLSVLFGLVMANVIALIGKKRAKLTTSSSVTGFGVIVGTLTVFCTICTLPFLSFTALGAIFSLFATYNIFFKLFSIKMMLGGLYLINRQLVQNCEMCKD